MRNTTDLNTLAALEEFVPRTVSTRGDTPLVFLRRGPAGNDPDVAASDAASTARPASYEMYHAARAHRSFIFGKIIAAAIRAVGAIARRVYARHRQRRQAKATYDALRRLDDRMLRDLGFDRSEMTSIAAEITGEAEYSRVRALPTSHGLPM